MKRFIKQPVRVLALVAACVVITATIVAAYHYHENGRLIDDCPLCRFQDSGFTAGVQNAACALVTPGAILFHVPVAYESVSFRHHALLASRPNAPPFMV